MDIDDQLLSVGFTLWKLQFLDLNFREFLFKMSQGMVHGNTVISHFGNVDRKCSFCKIQKLLEIKRELGREPLPNEWDAALLTISDENRAHIFWDCQTVQETLLFVQNRLWGVGVINKPHFLMGRTAPNYEAAALYQLVNMFIRFKIWNYKLANILPKKGTIVHETETFINYVCRRPSWRGQLPIIRQLALLPV
jgi:hypothetical protein